MKKIVLVLLLLTLICFFVVACEEDVMTSAQGESTDAPESTVTISEKPGSDTTKKPVSDDEGWGPLTPMN